MSNDVNFRQRFNVVERDLFASEELPVDSAMDDSSAHPIKKLDGNSYNGVKTAHIDLEDKNTYVQQLIPSLEDMATLVATLETSNYYYTTQCFGKFDYLRNVNKVIDNLMVPNRIREKMKALRAEMEQEVHSLRSVRSDILRLSSVNDYDSYSHFYLYGVVWDSSGHIDVKKTIEKALSRSRRQLNDDDFIFEVITKYCVVNCVMDFPLDSLSEEFITSVENTRSFESKLIYYWIKRKRRTTPDRYDPSYEFALTRMLDSLRWNTTSIKYQWSAYEYFWDFFDENDQVEVTKNLIRDEHYKKYQKILFSKLNKNQLKRLYSEEPLTIIVNFLTLGEFELTRAVWDRIKLTIEGQKYELLLEQILKNRIPTEDSCVEFSIYSWNTAPLNLIDYMINVKNCQITDKFLKRNSRFRSSSRCEFLKTVLSRTTPEFKQKFLLQAGPRLILNHRDMFISLINHCLNETDSVTVRENLLIEAMESGFPDGIEIMHRFRDLFYSSREEFNEFLQLFTLKPTLQTRFKEFLLRSQLLITKVLRKADNWEKLSQFLDELFPNPEVARYQKRNAVFTFLQTHCTYRDCYRPNGDEKFTEIDNLLNQVLTPREVITAKENIIDSFLEVCHTGWVRSLKRMNVQRFATWCYCGDEENTKRFRRSLPIDQLFCTLLSEVVERYVNGRDVKLSFSSLDELLRWKFSSKRRQVEKFKSREINRIMKRRAEKHISRKTNIYPSVLKKVIKWVFHGDKRQIREFELRYSDRDMMKIIHWMYLSEETIGCGDDYGHTSDESDD